MLKDEFLELRRRIIANDFQKMNDRQQEAIFTTEGPLLLLAGAGSGKTRVLTYKISYLLDQGLPPHYILALTFTNKAAREMKSRIAELVGEKKARQLWMGTFHSIFSRGKTVPCHDTDDERKREKKSEDCQFLRHNDFDLFEGKKFDCVINPAIPRAMPETWGLQFPYQLATAGYTRDRPAPNDHANGSEKDVCLHWQPQEWPHLAEEFAAVVPSHGAYRQGENLLPASENTGQDGQR